MAGHVINCGDGFLVVKCHYWVLLDTAIPPPFYFSESAKAGKGLHTRGATREDDAAAGDFHSVSPQNGDIDFQSNARESGVVGG